VELWLPVSLERIKHVDEARLVPLPATSRLCVMLVDDEEFVRVCTADVLVDMGYDVVEADCGEQALRLLDEGAAPDVVITDYLMPGMSGAELVSAMRARKPGLPILIVSGYAEPEGIAPDLPRLRKPYRSAELAQSIANLVRQDADQGI
jgi:CheY-like chemotaxis protein